MKVDWDPKKAAANKRKHGVTFQEAASCFRDLNGRYFRNESASNEDRLILIALSARLRLPFVVHAEVGRDAIRSRLVRRGRPRGKPTAVRIG